MEVRKRPILGLLMNKNKSSTKVNQEEESLSFQQKKLIAQKLAKEILAAQKVIQRAVKRWIFRRLAKRRTYMADIFYEADHDIAENIYLVGDFAQSKWEIKIPMNYSFYHRAFVTTVKISEGSQFKFIINGIYVCGNHFPMIYTKEKFINHCFSLRSNNLSKRHRLRLSNATKSFGDYLGTVSTHSDSRDHYYHMKNKRIMNHYATNSMQKSSLIKRTLGNKSEAFSPDMMLCRRRLFENSLVLNKFCSTKNQSNNPDMQAFADFSNGGMDSAFFYPNKKIGQPFELEDMGSKFSSAQKVKHIMTKNTKTPSQMVHNPLQALYLGDENNSQRDDMSDYTDDLYFLDEFVINTPFQVKNDCYSGFGFPTLESYKTDKNIAGSPLKTGVHKEECFVFVGEKVKISKNSTKPCGDASFISKFAMGVADGVGGWASYGIDPSKFSQSLMQSCKQIVDKKLHKALRSFNISKNDESTRGRNMGQTMIARFQERVKEFELQDSDDNSESDGNTCSSRDHSELHKAFGAPVRQKLMKRTRSSFHLDEHNLHATDKYEPSSPKSTTSGQGLLMKKLDFKIEPTNLMKEAYKRVDALGSSTALICTLQGKTLKISNLGDSTLLLMRYIPGEKSHVILKTEEQQHSFNAPYQLAKLPENLSLPSNSRVKNGKNQSKNTQQSFWHDKPSDSVQYQCNVKEGDIVILGTDGVFDNLFIKEILNIVDVFMTECLANSSHESIHSIKTTSNTPEFKKKQLDLMTKKNAKKLAKELLKEAYRKSRSQTCLTPFGSKFDKVNMRQENDLLRWKGGKPDDICVSVGFIKSLDIDC